MNADGITSSAQLVSVLGVLILFTTIFELLLRSFFVSVTTRRGNLIPDPTVLTKLTSTTAVLCVDNSSFLSRASS